MFVRREHWVQASTDIFFKLPKADNNVSISEIDSVLLEINPYSKNAGKI